MNDTAQNTTPEKPITPWDTLTARECEVALLLARGDTSREIAEALGVSIKTIDTHRGHIIEKLACKNNVGLVRFCIRAGLVQP